MTAKPARLKKKLQERGCDYCGLPVPGAWLTDVASRGPESLDQVSVEEKQRVPVYCCSGCRVAAAVEQADGAEGDSRQALLRLGLGIFCTMNVMVFTMALWSQDIYPEAAQDPSEFSVVLRGLFRYLTLLFSLPVLFFLGEPIWQGVWQALKCRIITTDLLITLGVLAAYLYSIVSVVRDQGHVYFEVGCMVLVFVTLGRWLEAHGKLQTSAALDALASLLPDQVRRVRRADSLPADSSIDPIGVSWGAALAPPPAQTRGQESIRNTENGDTANGAKGKVAASSEPDPESQQSEGQETERIDRHQARVGDWLRVLPGERFAVDGHILRGRAEIDEQIVTGESHTVSRGPGEQVSSGTLNIDGDLRIEVTAAAGEETVSRLLGLVRAARMDQGRHGQLADRLTVWFVPAVCIIALLATWWHARHGGIEQGILAGLAVVLIACPCALGLATPMAIWSALGRGARGQVLFRSGEALERLATVRVACFDKTGTITDGQASVDRLITDGHTERGVLLQTAKAMAAASTHTFSQAIGRFVTREASAAPGVPSSGAGRCAPANVETLPGLGLVAHFDSATSPGTQGPDAGNMSQGPTYLGSIRLMDQACLNRPGPLQRVIESTGAAGASLTGIGWENRLRGLFLFQESIRPETRQALADCRQLGLHTILLTGDHRGRAARIEQELEIPVEAEQLPADKVAAIEQLRGQHGPVAMVGDGINDAPALATSDVGVAMGCGADLTRESATVCLLSDDLLRFPWAVALARRGVRTIRQNLFWAFAYNSVGIALAASGRLNPVWAAVAMAGSSLAVIANSLRLARFPEPDGMDYR